MPSTSSKLLSLGKLRRGRERWARIASIRRAIARSTYDTHDKWEKMLDRLLRDLKVR